MDWRRLNVIYGVMLWVLVVSVGISDSQSEATSPRYDVIVATNIMVPMRDGVKLATDVYMPARNGVPAPGKFPVLVARTPYGKGSAASDKSVAYHFAQLGYVVAMQDCRGRYNSRGTFYIDVNEGADGYDTVEWAAEQPWSNGKVGTFGGSYLAQAQNALAVLRPPHLAAMFVMVGTSNYFDEGAYRGGAFTLLHNLVYPLILASTSQEADRDPALKTALLQEGHEQIGDWLRAYPFRPNASPLALDPVNQRWFQDFVDHSYYDDYWEQNGFNFEVAYDKYPDIPIYFLSGWYDLFERGTLHNYTGLAPRHKSRTKLLMGPWVHGIGPRSSGDVDFGPAAEVDLVAEQQRWFDAVLKGVKNGILEEAPVRVFVMGGGDGSRTANGRREDGGRWLATTAWPPPGESSRAYYLHEDGSLNEQLPGEETPTAYTFDPKHPVPTIGGQIDSGKEFSPDGPRDQRCDPKIFGCQNSLPLSSRRDVLVFQTQPLASDVEIAGPVTVELWISSSARDTDFTAKLVDVAPPSHDFPWGYAMNLADRIVRACAGDDVATPELLNPGAIRKVTIDLVGVANHFRMGHRIRVDISSSNFPFFDVNPNTGERRGYETHEVTAINTVYHDRLHPSHINLPVMPAGSGGEPRN
ncbi:MAG: CocE/NonD family hydrolase [Terriglobia bacterium]